MFIKLTRLKEDEVFDIYINADYIIGFKKRGDDKIGSAIEIAFPDTIRAYNVKEIPEEITDKIKLAKFGF